MEFRQSQAIYLQIADYVCEKILLEEWKVNDKIPSVRELVQSCLLGSLFLNQQP